VKTFPRFRGDKKKAVEFEQVSTAANRPAPRGASRPPRWYIDVDGQRDKLVTGDRHQFITLTVHLG